ncbi:MAG: formyl transferase [Pirellulales bacterium]|nr:formyl transferase [Pirellulales bacterium]
MNIVAISTLSPQHHFVLSAIDETWPLKAVLQPVWRNRGPTSKQWMKLLKSPIRTIAQRLQFGFYDWLDQRIHRQVANELGALSLAGPLETRTARIYQEDINSDETADIIRVLEPDLLITSSCPLLKRKIFAAPRLATINIHWGVAPHYRGEHTLFWPQYFGDYQNIGVTIHQIDDGIDTGPILAVGHPALSPDDTQATLQAKCARMSVELLAEVLTRIENGPGMHGLAPQGFGRLFLRRHRSFRHDIALWLRQWTGKRGLPRTEARREIFIGSGMHEPASLLEIDCSVRV